MKKIESHNKKINRIASQIKKSSRSNKRLRFYHGDTNSTRVNYNHSKYSYIDISNFNEIIEVNTKAKYVFTEPNVPMDKLVKETLKYGLIPAVVMEFPGITVGGAINGTSLESSSYKHGQLSDVCQEYEIILGNGGVISTSKNQNQDIFYGVSGSYGSLGLISLIKVSLVPSSKYVQTTFTPVQNWDKALKFIKEKINDSEVDFIEGIIFDKKNTVVITGKLTNNENLPIKTYSKASDYWFYDRAEQVLENEIIEVELVPIYDYLFRYNRGAFWMGEHAFSLLHIPSNKLTKFLLNPVMNTRKLHDGLVALNIGQAYFVQDFYFSYEKSMDFLKFTDKNLNIYPIWLCPIKGTKTPQKLSPHYGSDNIMLDIGVWGKTDKYSSNPIGKNREFEEFAKRSNARKMLYAHSYYTREEFWKIYDKKWYQALREKYYADKVFPDVWEKVHVEPQKYKVHYWSGILKILIETIKGRHINT